MIANETRDRRAGYVLHHEVRQAIVRRACVQQTRDIGMIEPGQDVSLRGKTAQNFLGIGAAFQDLDRHFLLELSIGARCQVNRSHSAPAKLPHYYVSSYPPAR